MGGVPLTISPSDLFCKMFAPYSCDLTLCWFRSLSFKEKNASTRKHNNDSIPLIKKKKKEMAKKVTDEGAR